MTTNTDTTAIKKIQLTQEGLDELKAELDELKNVKLPAAIQRVAAARAHGDISENAEYSNAKEEQALLETRVSEIEDILERAEVIQQTKSHTKVGIGSTVVTHLKSDKKRTMMFHIVGEFESNPSEGKVSSVSPIGKTLMNKKVGDEAVVKAPAGEVIYLINEIK